MVEWLWQQTAIPRAQVQTRPSPTRFLNFKLIATLNLAHDCTCIGMPKTYDNNVTIKALEGHEKRCTL